MTNWEDAERGGGGHERGHGHDDGKPGLRGEHDPAATNDVAERAGQQGTEHHSQQGIAAQRSRDRAGVTSPSWLGSFRKMGTTAP